MSATNLLYRKRLVRFEREICALEALDSPHIPKTGEMGLRSAPTGFAPQDVVFAERFDGGEWVRESPSGPGWAVRVVGRSDFRPAE